ncbi:MAG: hypothetical protein FJZ16_01505 [Candidatus Omnitrophica bacterium]|nr:hypothetical protein [Candidatus Omnitrophota bacterium]
MKIKGIILIVLGILGVIFVCTIDIIMGKPVNDISGPKSIAGLIVSGLFVIIGIFFILKGLKKK